MLFATLPVAEKAYISWAIANTPIEEPEPAALPPGEAEHDEPALLPWERPDEDDETPAGDPTTAEPPVEPSMATGADDDPPADVVGDPGDVSEVAISRELQPGASR